MLGMGYVGMMRGELSLDIRDYRARLREAAGLTGQFTKEVRAQVNSNMLAMQRQHSKIGMGATLLTTVVAPLAYGVRRSEKIFGDYQLLLGKIQVVARLSNDEMKQIDKNMISMGKNIGVKPTEMMKAGYIAAQSMFTDVKDIQLIAKKAADITVASGWETTPEKAADNITRMLSAFGLPTSKLQELNDLMLRTRDVGRFTMEELGDSAGKAASVMAAAFPKDKMKAMEELFVLMASGTLGGVPHNMMATGVRSLLNAVYRESRNPKSKLNALTMGLKGQSAASMMGSMGAIDFFAEISKATGGYMEFVNALGFHSREALAMAAVIRNSMVNTNQASAQLKNSAGSEAKGLAQHMDSWTFLKSRLVAFREAFALAFGKVIVPYLIIATEFVIKMFKKLEESPDFVKHFIVWAGVLLGVKSTLYVISGIMGIISMHAKAFGYFGLMKNGKPANTIRTAASALAFNIGQAPWKLSMAKGLNNMGEILFGSETKKAAKRAVEENARKAAAKASWSDAKYSAMSVLSGYLFGNGKVPGSHSMMPNIPAAYMADRQFRGFLNHSKYKNIHPDDIASAWKQAHQNVRYNPTTGYANGPTLQKALNFEMRKILGTATTAGLIPGLAGGAVAKSGGTIVTKLPSMALMLFKAIGIAYAGFTIIKGWWSSISEGFLTNFRDFMEAIGIMIPSLDGLKISADTLWNIFIGLSVGIETVIDVFKAVAQVLFGFAASFVNIFPTMYRAISAWLNPGNKKQIDPATGTYKTVMTKNWLGLDTPVKNSRMEAFGDAWKEGVLESGAIIDDAVKTLFSKETWDKISTSKQWAGLNYPKYEVVSRTKEEGSGSNGNEPPTPPDTFNVSREYASAYLHGSTEAWNARLPYYLTKDQGLEVQKQQLSLTGKSNDELKKIRELLQSNQMETYDGVDLDGADLGL